MNFRLKLIFFYCVSAVILITGLTSIYRLFEKADLPFEYHSEKGKLISDSNFKDIEIGDCISGIDNIAVTSTIEAEFILDTKRIGDEVSLAILNEKNMPKTSLVNLVYYYKNNFFILISLIVGLSYWLTGIYVIASKPHDKSAKILCLTLVTFSLAILSNACYFGRGSDWMGYVIRISHPISYIMGSVFFLHFTFIFPNDLFRKQKTIIISLYSFAAVFGISIIFSLYISMRYLDNYWLNLFINLWTLTQLFLLLSIISGTIILLIKYRKLSENNEKTKLEWIFWGLALGVSPFMIFWLIPSIFGLPYIFSEELILPFLILIPVSFAIAVIKYHLFDIEVIIKRSIVYSSLIILILLLYFGMIYVLSFISIKVIGEDSKTLNLIAAIFIAMVFNPLRVKLKHYVDSVFYREKYFFDKAITDISGKIKNCETMGKLGDILIEEIDLFIPVKSIAVCILTTDGERLRILEQKNFDELSKNISTLRVKKLFSKFNLLFAVKEKIENISNLIRH
jgi:hypothetical protein